MIFNNKNIIPLLITYPKSLNDSDKRILIDAYDYFGRMKVYSETKKNKIIPFAACVFKYLDIDFQFWSENYESFKKKNQKITHLLNELFSNAELSGIKSLALSENFGSLLMSNSSLGCFSSGDVDIFADINEKRNIEICLKDLSFTCVNRAGRVENYSKQLTMYHNPKFTKTGFWINLLWTTTSRAFLNQRAYDKRLIKERLLAEKINGTNIRVLRVNALLYYCALHIACGHYYTLSPGYKLYVDIDRIVRKCDINWEIIKSWCEEDKSGLRVTLVFMLSKKLLKSPIPEDLFQNFLSNRRFNKLLNYLFNQSNNQIIHEGGRLHRLYVEILSSNKSFINVLISNFS